MSQTALDLLNRVYLRFMKASIQEKAIAVIILALGISASLAVVRANGGSIKGIRQREETRSASIPQLNERSAAVANASMRHFDRLSFQPEANKLRRLLGQR